MRNRVHEVLPGRDVGLEVLVPFARQLVDLGPPVGRAVLLPLGLDQLVTLEPVERGVERALLNPQPVVCQMLDLLADGVSKTRDPSPNDRTAGGSRQIASSRASLFQ